jgi:hypothetical protein
LLFDKPSVVTTSARRLQRGLLYNLAVTLVFYYLGGYVVNSLTSRTVLGTAPAFRDEAPRRRRGVFVVGVPLTVCCLLIWAV